MEAAVHWKATGSGAAPWRWNPQHDSSPYTQPLTGKLFLAVEPQLQELSLKYKCPGEGNPESPLAKSLVGMIESQPSKGGTGCDPDLPGGHGSDRRQAGKGGGEAPKVSAPSSDLAKDQPVSALVTLAPSISPTPSTRCEFT